MKNKLWLLILPVFCFCLSGCFGIEEKVLIHKDGSGTFTYTIDATQMMKDMMMMVEKMSKAFASDTLKPAENKKDYNAEFHNEMSKKMQEDFAFDEKKKEMNAMKGISEFDQFVDTTGGAFRMGMKFNFTNVNALNKALKVLLAKKEGKKKSENLPPASYSFEDGVLTRELDKKAAEGLVGGDKDSEAVLKLMKDFKYTIIVQGDNNIKSSTAPGAIISKGDKQVTLDYQLMDKSMSKKIVESKMKSEVKVY